MFFFVDNDTVTEAAECFVQLGRTHAASAMALACIRITGNLNSSQNHRAEVQQGVSYGVQRRNWWSGAEVKSRRELVVMGVRRGEEQKRVIVGAAAGARRVDFMGECG